MCILQTCRATIITTPTCNLQCNTGVCKIVFGQGPRCICPPQYSGAQCEIFRCSVFCKNKGLCYVDLLSSKTPDAQPPLRCNCQPQFTGERCEIPVNMCDGRCFNGGTCYGTRPGEPQCNCQPGFHGSRCQDCSKFECKNGGVCFRNETKEICQCSAGYRGDNCEVSDCDNFCSNFGKCVLTPTGPRCTCASGFAGPRCDQDACFQHCQNGGTCRIGTKQPECICPPLYSGRRCEISTCLGSQCGTMKPCECKHNGSCEIRSGNHVCKCPDVWGGEICDVSVFKKNISRRILI